MLSPIKPSLYERLESERGSSPSAMPVTQDAHVRSTMSGVEGSGRPPTPTSPTIVGENTRSPSPAETLVEETSEEPCISFEKDYNPSVNLHSLAYSLVQDRLAKGHNRSELLEEQFRLREKAMMAPTKKQPTVEGEKKEKNDEHAKPLTGRRGCWEPTQPLDRSSPAYLFHTVIILMLEENPVMGTSRRGVGSRLRCPLPISNGTTSMIGGTCAGARAGAGVGAGGRKVGKMQSRHGPVM